MRSNRRGFTLIELLIVVAIIGVLLYLTVRAAGAMIIVARESATDATIRKVQSLLDQRSQAVYRLTSRAGFVQTSKEYNDAGTIQLAAIGGGNVLAKREIIAKKQIARKYFPQMPLDVNNSIQPKAFAAGTTLSNGEILYDFLINTNVGGPVAGTDAFSASELSDADLDSFPEIVDAWGHPLRFYRWPTRLFRPTGDPTFMNPLIGIDPTNAKLIFGMLPAFSGNVNIDLARDPDDPLRNMTLIPNFESGSGSLFHTPATFHVLLIASAGPDGVLGLYEPDDVSTNKGWLAAVKDTNALSDDLCYFSLRGSR